MNGLDVCDPDAEPELDRIRTRGDVLECDVLQFRTISDDWKPPPVQPAELPDNAEPEGNFVPGYLREAENQGSSLAHKRRGKGFRGRKDWAISYNTDTLNSTSPQGDSQPAPPGRLEELLLDRERLPPSGGSTLADFDHDPPSRPQRARHRERLPPRPPGRARADDQAEFEVGPRLGAQAREPLHPRRLGARPDDDRARGPGLPHRAVPVRVDGEGGEALRARGARQHLLAPDEPDRRR